MFTHACHHKRPRQTVSDHTPGCRPNGCVAQNEGKYNALNSVAFHPLVCVKNNRVASEPMFFGEGDDTRTTGSQTDRAKDQLRDEEEEVVLTDLWGGGPHEEVEEDQIQDGMGGRYGTSRYTQRLVRWTHGQFFSRVWDPHENNCPQQPQPMQPHSGNGECTRCHTPCAGCARGRKRCIAHRDWTI